MISKGTLRCVLATRVYDHFRSERPHGYHVDGFAHFLILTAVFCIFFSSRNTSLSAQVTTDESKALSFGLIIHIRKRLLWTTYTRFTPLSSRSLSSLTCRPFGRSLTKVLTCR